MYVCMYRSFLDNELEMEFALPSTVDDESIECSIKLAEEMNILYEKGGRVSYRTLLWLHTLNALQYSYLVHLAEDLTNFCQFK